MDEIVLFEEFFRVRQCRSNRIVPYQSCRYGRTYYLDLELRLVDTNQVVRYGYLEIQACAAYFVK